VSAPGLVVVNYAQLDVTLPSDPSGANVLKLILAKESDREEMARRFYRLKSMETYQQLLSAASRDQAQLRKELERFRAADRTADDFAKLAPQQASDLQKSAMRLFASGKMPVRGRIRK
jgi:hypothetical protein